MIEVDVEDGQVQKVLARLAKATGDLSPLMQDLGEYFTLSTKQRFAKSVAPNGTPWAPNAPSTMIGHLDHYKGSYNKDGRLSAKGARRAGGKKPLIGETRSLSTTIHYVAGADYVQIGSGMEYAAVQQFGAKKHSFTGGKTPWGDIPARPYLGMSGEDVTQLGHIVAEYLLHG